MRQNDLVLFYVGVYSITMAPIITYPLKNPIKKFHFQKSINSENCRNGFLPVYLIKLRNTINRTVYTSNPALNFHISHLPNYIVVCICS